MATGGFGGLFLQNHAFLAERHARTQTVAATCVAGRVVVELLVHLDADGRELAWPVAVVAECPTDVSVVVTYRSRWPVDGRRYVRPPILDPRQVQLRDVVGRYQAALEAGDAEAAVGTFAPDGYVHPLGQPQPSEQTNEDNCGTEPAAEDRAQRGLFETIKATDELASEPEQHAMVNELRTRMPTISFEERMELIDDIHNAIGQNLEEELEF